MAAGRKLSEVARRFVRPAVDEGDAAAALRELRDACGQYPPGHYYSPIPEASVAVAMGSRNGEPPPDVPGIEFDVDAMLADAERWLARKPDVELEQPRWKESNGFFDGLDALGLEGILVDRDPSTIVEVGAGWSTCRLLDTLDRWPHLRPRVTVIEPDPVRLLERLHADDEARMTLLAKPVQEVDRSTLLVGPGDVLFIDSSHVVKAGSDVNLLLLDVLPRLPVGAIVHIHDIPWGFEYPVEWMREGRYWSEAYLVQALIAHNPRYQILWFAAWVGNVRPSDSPLPDAPGGSLWLEVR